MTTLTLVVIYLNTKIHHLYKKLMKLQQIYYKNFIQIHFSEVYVSFCFYIHV